MSIYFTRIMNGDGSKFPFLNHLGYDVYTFSYDGENEQDASRWFRDQVMGNGVHRWLSPLDLSRDQRWLDDETADWFREAREKYGLED